MIHIFKKLLPFLLVLMSVQGFTQSSSKNYQAIDEYVKKIGPLDSMNLGTISTILTKKFSDKTDKLRAIFDWIAFNIDMDLKAAKNNTNDKHTGTEVLKARKANGAGYATLFQDMCSVAEIRCLTVEGFTKRQVTEINDPADEFNHTWNVVQLGQSPDNWYYIDVCRASGYTDPKFTSFTKSFNDVYFFADRTIFNLQNFPNNQAWKMGAGPKSKKEFYELPLITNAAYEFSMYDVKPATGKIKNKPNKPVEFDLTMAGNNDIKTVVLSMGDKKKITKQVDYTFTGSHVNFKYQFEEGDSFPVSILINGKEVVAYLLEAE